jgi:dTDP-4-dehydrorhamnose 3,5-epimerase
VSKRGALRGIHFADVPLGQAKYVTATRGTVLDFAIDIRVGSPTFGQWASVLLDDKDRKAIYLAEGLGHAFIALTDDATVSYLVSDTYNPSVEHGITPLDRDLGLKFPMPDSELLLSPKDIAAPTLAEAQSEGLLPDWAAVTAYYETLNNGSR